IAQNARTSNRGMMAHRTFAGTDTRGAMDESGWQPWTAQEVEALLEEDVALLSQDEVASFASVKMAPRVLDADDGKSTHWVVAERAGRVLYWDSVEEEFGVGRLKEGKLTQS